MALPASGGEMNYTLTHLRAIESEAMHIMREVAAEFERPCLLFSGGKDSIVMLRIAEKAFWPARIPFTLMHVDTGHNFDEVLEYRDRRAADPSERPGSGLAWNSLSTGPGRGSPYTTASSKAHSDWLA